MKILFILEHYLPHIGGVEILFENLIKGLLDKWHDVTVLTTKFKKSLSSEEQISDRYKIVRVGSNRYNFMRNVLRTGISLAKKCDLIHTTTYNAAIPAWIIAMITGKKVVITVHEIFTNLWTRFYGLKGLLYQLFEKLIFCFSFDFYVCVSHYTKNSLRLFAGIKDTKLATIYNGIDTTLRDSSKISEEQLQQLKAKLGIEKSYTGLRFGRPGISKGLEYYIQAIPSIVEKIPEFKAVLIVSQDDHKRYQLIKKLIKQLQIWKYIILLDPVPYKSLREYIMACDCTIVSSLVEGFGFAAAEVSALGKPLVVSNVGSLPEVVSGKIVFVEPSNAEEIAKWVENCYTNNRMLIPSKKFSWSDTVEKTLEIYERVGWNIKKIP